MDVDNLTDQEALVLGARAQALLEDELLAAAFDHVREELINEWVNSEADDGQRREELWRQLRSLERVQQFLAHVLSNSHLIKHRIEAKHGTRNH